MTSKAPFLSADDMYSTSGSLCTAVVYILNSIQIFDSIVLDNLNHIKKYYARFHEYLAYFFLKLDFSSGVPLIHLKFVVLLIYYEIKVITSFMSIYIVIFYCVLFNNIGYCILICVSAKLIYVPKSICNSKCYLQFNFPYYTLSFYLLIKHTKTHYNMQCHGIKRKEIWYKCFVFICYDFCNCLAHFLIEIENNLNSDFF